jgi:PAS domain S-box-containing protein
MGSESPVVRDSSPELAVEELTPPEEIARILLEQSLVGVAIMQDWRMIFINNAFVELSGLTRDEIMTLEPDRLRALIHPEDKAMVERRYESRISDRPVRPRYEFRIHRKDGSLRTIEIYSRKVTCFGKPAVLLAALDITEKKEADEALKESRALYATLVEQAHDAVIIQQDDRFVFANEAAGRLLGYSVEEMMGMGIADITAPHEKDRIQKRHQRRMAGEQVPAIYESTGLRKDGSQCAVEVSVATITYKGRPAAMAIMRDISERHRLEEELVRAQKLESIGLLAGGIAHDFNNVLTSIQGSIALAVRNMDRPGKALQNLESAEMAVGMAKNIAKQLLTFSKGGDPVKEHIRLRDFLRNAAEFAAAGSRVRCLVDVDADLWDIEADPGQITQVLSNLMLNAVQAMTEGGDVRLEARNLEVHDDNPVLRDGFYVKITISDQGCGIPPDALPRIFDPYFSTKPAGHGLGLTAAYSIVKKHGGHVTADSKEGEGTTLSVFLPALHERGAAVSEEKAEPQAGRPGARILVMDDEELVRGVVEKILVSLGYDVITAKDGAEAIERYREAREQGRPFDAVILDLTVAGGLGGREAVAALRRMDPKARVIVSSGYSTDPVLANYQEYGFNGAIIKPFGVKELSRSLNRILSAG